MNVSLNVITKHNIESDVVLIISVLRIFFVLLLRAGFLLIQLGSIPTENALNTLIQNIVDFVASSLSFCLWGYTLFAGKSRFDGIIGYGTNLNDNYNLAEVSIGYSAVIIGSSVITTLMSGRLHLVSTLVCSIGCSSVLLPVVIHWIWNPGRWTMNQRLLDSSVSLLDEGGACVHLISALFGLIGALFLGRRILRLTHIDKSSVGAESLGTTMVGYFLIMVGLIAFYLPYTTTITSAAYNHSVGLVVINSVTSLTSAMLIVCFFNLVCSRQQLSYWDILRCVQASIAGLVVISAGITKYTPLMAATIGLLGGLVFHLSSRVIYATSLEDYCHSVATHFMCAALSLMLPPLLGNSEQMGYKSERPQLVANFLCQIGCLICICFINASIGVLMFLILWCTGFLRNQSESICHYRSLLIDEDRLICCTRRLFNLVNHESVLTLGLGGGNSNRITSTLSRHANIISKSLQTKRTANDPFGTQTKLILKSKSRLRSDNSTAKLQEASTRDNNFKPEIRLGLKIKRRQERAMLIQSACESQSRHVQNDKYAILNQRQGPNDRITSNMISDTESSGSVTSAENLEDLRYRKKHYRQEFELHKATHDIDLAKFKRHNFKQNKNRYNKSISQHIIRLPNASVATDRRHENSFIT